MEGAARQEDDAGLAGSSSHVETVAFASSVRELLSLHTQLHVAQLRQKQAVLSTMLEQLASWCWSLLRRRRRRAFAWEIRSLRSAAHSACDALGGGAFGGVAAAFR